MLSRQTLLFDCDGVLYPLVQLPTQKIVAAMKETYRLNLGLSGEEQQRISEETRKNNRLGMFNYIKAMCEYKNYAYEHFCAQMVERIDYHNIAYNCRLAQLLFQIAKDCNVGILTNNSRAHVAKVLEHTCKTTLAQTEANGIKIFDVAATEKNGVFLCKQPEGLALICQRNNYQPEQTTLFDDAPANIAAAREIGMHGVLINEKMNLQKALMPFMRVKENNVER